MVELLEKQQDLIDDFMGREHWRMAPNHEWRSYHNDWNLLMPVVEKIETLGFNVNIVSIWCDVERKTMKVDLITEADGETKIQATYKAVVEFIKWYNNQNQ